ncbi:MAG: hypothetical protein IJ193_04100 [Bacilli bacterium]|nr:hypothetical protein [Bacilli bacterium]
MEKFEAAETQLDDEIHQYYYAHREMFSSCREWDGTIPNFFWWRLVFTKEFRETLKDEYKDYEGIHLTSYYVDQKLWEEIQKKEKMDDRTLPNIDFDSGNLHPILDDDYIKEFIENPTIKQAVLIKSNREENGRAHFGPGFDKEPNFNCYTLEQYETIEEYVNHLLVDKIK